MAQKRIMGVAAVVSATALILVGSASGGNAATGTKITGSITVLTNRTDLVDTAYKNYVKEFEKAYPGTTVKVEAIGDYEGEVKIRLNTKDYGDALFIPNSVTKNQLSNFFEPLGTVKQLKGTYRFINEAAYHGNVYGISSIGDAHGLVYNKKVWAAAGITTLPKTPVEFINDLKLIKAKTGATPYYTNYAGGWPVSKWENNPGMTGNPNELNKLINTGRPWTPGQYHYIVDSLLYNIVHDGLSEKDPLTTNWEESKSLIGSGKVATMLLGSWAIVQMQDAAVKAGGSRTDIGYMPFPYQVKGKFYSTISSDYKDGVNKYSSNKATARAWVAWFAAKSNFATDQGGLSPMLNGPTPDTLKDFAKTGVQFIELNPAPAGKETLLSDIANAAEIDLWGNVYRQKLIDIARGAAPGDMKSYFAQLNKRWAAARATMKG